MRGITFILVFSQLALAGVRVEKVLETASTEKYNQWVAKNRAVLPGLRPILVDFEAVQDTKTLMREYKIYYYSGSGKLLKKENIKGELISLGIPKTLDRIFIYKSHGYKEGSPTEYCIKNAKGNIILTPQTSMTYIGMGMYVESHISEDGFIPPRVDARIFDNTGNEIGIIKDLAAISQYQLCIANDERYAVSRGFVAKGRPIICIDATGKVRWRRDFEPSADYLYISADGDRIAVHHGTRVTILNEDGSLVNTITPFDKRAMECGLSPDGNLLVVSKTQPKPWKISLYDVATGKLIWCDDSTLTNNNDVAKSVHIDAKHRIIVFSRSNNLYILSKDGKLEHKQNLDLGTEMHSVRVGAKGWKILTKKVEVPAKTWFAEVHGEYLIITLGRASINDCYRTVRKRIVYRIIGNE